MSYVYLVLCKDGTIYTGYTKNMLRRIKEHESGKGARWVKDHGFKGFSYYEIKDDKEARRKEKEIKRFTHEQKIVIMKLLGIH